MKTLIVYYSFSGNNELLAKKLQSLLNCQIMKISEHKKRTNFSIVLDILLKRTPKLNPPTLQITDYEYIIFVAPIWAGKIASPLKAFIKSLDEKIIKYSFISLCGSRDNGNVASELTSLTGRKPFKLLEIAANDLAPAGSNFNQNSLYRATEGDLLKVDQFLHSFIDHTELIADTASA